MDIDGNNYCPRCMRKLAETDTDVSACPLCGREPGTLRPPMALDGGTLLAGRYQLGDVIGQGGFGITYAAWDETLGMPVAVKEFFPREDATRNTEISDDLAPLPEREAVFTDGLSRFRRESNLLASLQGIPCVVKVMDFFSENETAYIVMEFVHGTPIDRWVRENDIKPAALLEKLRPVADALVRTHSQGVIHRDVTPDNILVEEDGNLKLIDFGSAVEVERSEGTVLLTRKYAPVEQYGRDYGRQGPWTDVYSLAAVMYTLFSGQEPVEAPLRAHHDEQKPLARMHTGLKGREAAAIDRALIVDPEKRTQSMAEFRAALYHLPMPEEVIRRKRFTRRVIAAAAVLFLLLGLVTLNFTTGLPIGSGLLGSVRSNGVHIVRKLRKQEEVRVPESVLGIPVSEINSDAFRGDGTLRKVDIPGSVKVVGDSAFYNCDKLEEASLAEGVETVGNLAFGGCGSLLTLTLPDSLEAIGDSALPEQAELMTVWGSRGTKAEQYCNEHEFRFSVASELTWEIQDGTAEITSVQSEAKRLTLPNTVDRVPVTAIAEGVHLLTQEEVWLPEYLEVVTPWLFSLEDLPNAWIWANIIQAIDSTKEVDIRSVASPVYSVRMGAFVREIGEGAFCNCEVLTELILPDTLEKIGASAFFFGGIKELKLPDGLREIGLAAFYGTSITHMTVPDSVESIGGGAFANTKNLVGIDLLCNITCIPNGVFSDSNISTIDLPNTVTTIEDGAFSGTALQWIALPEGVRTIGSKAFSSCHELGFIQIPASVEEIHSDAFDQCLADLVIAGYSGSAEESIAKNYGFIFEDIGQWSAPEKWEGTSAVYESTHDEKIIHVPWYNRQDNFFVDNCICSDNPYVEELILSPYQTEISDQAYKGDTALRRVIAEGGIRIIGEEAFSGCYMLEDISLEKATNINVNAFKDCRNLRHLSLGKVTSLGGSAFKNCTSAQDLQLSENLTTIPASVFVSCFSLKYAVLPRCLREIEADTFWGCSSLQLVVFEEGANADVNGRTFIHCPALQAVYFPSTISKLDILSWAYCNPQMKDVWFFNPDIEFSEQETTVWDFVHMEVYEIKIDEPPAWTIHGYAGSTAEQWAKENGVRFEPIPEGTVMPDPWEIVASYDFMETEDNTVE